MTKQTNKWRIDPKEVTWRGSALTSGRRNQAAKSGRTNTITGMELELTHVPTKKSIKGKVPNGHYSKSQMKQKREELFKKLYAELEIEVAAFLRIGGRV